MSTLHNIPRAVALLEGARMLIEAAENDLHDAEVVRLLELADELDRIADAARRGGAL